MPTVAGRHPAEPDWSTGSCRSPRRIWVGLKGAGLSRERSEQSESKALASSRATLVSPDDRARPRVSLAVGAMRRRQSGTGGPASTRRGAPVTRLSESLLSPDAGVFVSLRTKACQSLSLTVVETPGAFTARRLRPIGQSSCRLGAFTARRPQLTRQNPHRPATFTARRSQPTSSTYRP
jgi:hypothetical protein